MTMNASCSKMCAIASRNENVSRTILAKYLRASCSKVAQSVHETQQYRGQKEASTEALRERQIGPRGKCCFAAHQLQRQATHYVSTLVYLLKTNHLSSFGLLP